MAASGHLGAGYANAAQPIALSGAHRAQKLLHFVFVVAPLVMGLDKYFNILTDWEKYLAPWIPNLFHTTPYVIMYIVGAIEIVAAIIVLFKPRIGGYIVALWLLGILINLVTNPVNWGADAMARQWDIFLRDFGLLCGALVLSWLSTDKQEAPELDNGGRTS